MSIRWRLALSFALLLVIPAIIASMFFYVAFRRYVISEQVDSRLKVYSTLFLATLAGGATDNFDYDVISSTLVSLGDTTSPAIWVQLTDDEGNVLVKSDNLGGENLPFVSRPQSPIVTVTSANGDQLRLLPLSFAAEGQTYQLQFAQSLASVDPILSRMGLTLFLVVLVSLALAFASAAVLVGRALSPVKKVTATAQSITSSSDLSRRVNYSGPKDEIGRLAATFDQMIEQLDGLMRSQRSFVADASHELRGPLTVIQGNLGLLRRNLSEQDRQESLRALEAEAARMTRVINDLLVLAEAESGLLEQQQMVSLRELLLDAQDRVTLLAGDRQIIIGRQDDLWVKGDAHKLDQMINNLVSNAVRYTPEGGIITLSLSQEGDWARLDVADTGIGIPPEHLPHLFDRFYRVDKARSRAAGGTGLGLAIVKGIAEQHGGRVAVTSELGKGTTFTVWLKL
jgi:two-component system OmpR family sensor kinase